MFDTTTVIKEGNALKMKTTEKDSAPKQCFEFKQMFDGFTIHSFLTALK